MTSCLALHAILHRRPLADIALLGLDLDHLVELVVLPAWLQRHDVGVDKFLLLAFRLELGLRPSVGAPLCLVFFK